MMFKLEDTPQYVVKGSFKDKELCTAYLKEGRLWAKINEVLELYVPHKELAYEFEVGESTVRGTITWIEDTLVKAEKFKLPGKKRCLKPPAVFLFSAFPLIQSRI